MTLIEIVKEFIKIAKKQPNINYTFEGDVYKLSSVPNINYSIFGVTQSSHRQEQDTIVYTLNLFYMDRIKQDESNLLQVQSNAIMMLGNIINLFANYNDDVEVDYNINYTTFSHKIAEVCGGAYCTVNIRVDNGIGICGFE